MIFDRPTFKTPEVRIILPILYLSAVRRQTVGPSTRIREKILPGSNFGFSVAISGETVGGGAIFDDLGVNSNQGSASVFTRSGAVWTQTQKLTATDGAIGDEFGYGVAVSGDKIVTGAIFSDVSVSSPLTGGFAPQAVNQGGAYFFINTPISPTAAGVAVSGRVSTADGRGLRNAVVYLTKANGETISTRTTTFGYYRFDGLEAGQTVIVGVSSKRYQFAPQVIDLTESLTNVDFTALE